MDTDFQLVKLIVFFDNQTNLVRSSNHVKNKDFLTKTLVQVADGPQFLNLFGKINIFVLYNLYNTLFNDYRLT